MAADPWYAPGRAATECTLAKAATDDDFEDSDIPFVPGVLTTVGCGRRVGHSKVSGVADSGRSRALRVLPMLEIGRAHV